MAENYDLIFGQSASQQYAWSDSDYQNGWQTVGSTPPTAEQFDALQRRSDTKAKDLNERLEPLETKAEADGRQAATAYAKGAMVTADGLPNWWLLECIVPGTTGAGALVIPSPLVIGGTIIDGTVTWTICKNIGTGNAPLIAGYNAKQTFTSSGSFTAPVTGTYKITLVGGGGGGGAASTIGSGHGGGQGGHLEFYEKLTAGTSYNYTIGAGSSGGVYPAGQASSGGVSSITINSNVYECTGGGGGKSPTSTSSNEAGGAGVGKINNIVVTRAEPGAYGIINGGNYIQGGAGGGAGGGNAINGTAVYGGGGGGGIKNTSSSGASGGAGGDGYITFEWLDTSLL